MKLGGGALQEHSHGLHLSIYLLNKLSSQNLKITNYKSHFKKNGKKKYDFYNIINLESNKKFVSRNRFIRTKFCQASHIIFQRYDNKMDL